MATTNSVKQHKLRRLIAWLSDKEGRGMEFISLYIPQEKSIDEIVAILKCESDSATRNLRALALGIAFKTPSRM